jgi:hypothetical protein
MKKGTAITKHGNPLAQLDFYLELPMFGHEPPGN